MVDEHLISLIRLSERERRETYVLPINGGALGCSVVGVSGTIKNL